MVHELVDADSKAVKVFTNIANSLNAFTMEAIVLQYVVEAHIVSISW